MLPAIENPENTIAHIQKVTAFKDRETAIAAIETLLWLEAGAPHKFDGVEGKVEFRMSSFLNSNLNDCDTVCCIAGAIYLFMSEDIKNRIRDKNCFLFNSNNLDNVFNTDQHLESGDLELSRLFYGYLTDRPESWASLININAEEAAFVFRNYLFTGKTDWTLSSTMKKVESE